VELKYHPSLFLVKLFSASYRFFDILAIICPHFHQFSSSPLPSLPIPSLSSSTPDYWVGSRTLATFSSFTSVHPAELTMLPFLNKPF